MRFQEIQEACWTGYRQAGMKKKGDRQVPNCVPVEEVKLGPEITANQLLYKAAAMAMRDASHEGISLDYEQAIRQASKIYGIPYQPSELPKLLAQRQEIDRQLALLKQGKQVAKQRRQAKLAPTPAGTDEYWRTHALPTDRIKPATKTLEAIEEDLKKWFKEKWVRFGPDGKIRGDCARGSSKEGKPKCLPQSKAHALGKKGRASAAAKKRREDPNAERRGAAKNVATKVNEFAPGAGDDNEPDFNPETFYDIPKLKKVYKQLASRSVNSGWYDFQLTRLIGAMEDLYTINADVLDDMFPTAPEIANYIERNIIKAFPSENPPYIIKNPDYKPRAPRAPRPGMIESRGGNYEELGLRKSSADRFAVLDRTLDAVIMTTNDLKAAKQEAIEWADYDDIRTEIIDQVTGKKIFAVDGNAGAMKYLDEKQDACYRKVKSRYKVWPSAYASGALVQCRKKGAANWGNKKK
jgi:hypothetical protein